MKKTCSLFGVALLISLAPLFAAAVTTEELKAQIDSLLVQITSLQQQMTRVSSPVQVVPQTVFTIPNYCPALSRDLARGADGSDVQSLQRYLIWQGLLSPDSSTGFFGSMTEASVQKWQATHDVVSSGSPVSTGWGAVGPRTRAAILVHCTAASKSSAPSTLSCPIAPPPTTTVCSSGWQANTDANGCTISYKCSVPLPGTASNIFSASPTSGGSPLIVTFSTNIRSPTSYSAGAYQIDYGDGRVDSIAGCSLASVCTLDSGTRTHTFTNSGTYAARLVFVNRSSCSGGLACAIGQETVASMSITVQ